MFALGFMAVLMVEFFLWVFFLCVKNRALKQKICGLMYGKGLLVMRSSILEDALKEKGR